MTDDRPRPRYGEYATPQHQAEKIAESLPPVSPVLLPPTAPTASTDSTPAPVDPAPETRAPQPTADNARPSTAPARRQGRRWDRILTIALLAYGAFTVLNTLLQNLDIGSVLTEVYAAQGIGQFTANSSADSAGLAIKITTVVVYAVVLSTTIALLRAGRLSFWVPLAGGILTVLISTGVLLALMIGDPVFQSYLSSLS